MGLRCVNIRVMGGGIEVRKSILSAFLIASVVMSDKCFARRKPKSKRTKEKKLGLKKIIYYEADMNTRNTHRARI